MTRIAIIVMIVCAWAMPAFAEDPCNPNPPTCNIIQVQSNNPVFTGRVGNKIWVTSDICQPVNPSACAEALKSLREITAVPFHAPVREFIVHSLAEDCQNAADNGFGCTRAQHKALGK